MATARKPQVLLVENDRDWREMARLALKGEGFATDEAASIADAVSKLARRRPQLLVLDRKLPDGDGVRLLQELRVKGFETPALIVTGHPSLESAVQALGLDATDYLVKPLPAETLAQRARDFVEEPSVAACQFLWDSLRAKFGFDHAFSSHPLVQRCYVAAARVAGATAPVLIEGETGVGKEYLSRAVHYMSPRAARPFVALNCAALPETLLESELFGHEKGAFTSASAAKRGLAEEADGGTLFLDEIGELPLTMQVKLLRFLEEGAFRRLGATSLTQVDVRIVAATNKDLLAEVDAGRFREDLFYRLAVIPLYLPPLRERPSDIELFSRTFVARHAGEDVALADDALSKLVEHDWPGNLRELHNVIRRAVLLRRAHVIRADDVRFGSIGRA